MATEWAVNKPPQMQLSRRKSPSFKGRKMNAPGSGRGGRRFKSCHSDQLHIQAAELTQLSEKDSELRAPKVHKGVHRHALRMVRLRQDTRGNYVARKRLPDNLREEYGRCSGRASRRSSTRPPARSGVRPSGCSTSGWPRLRQGLRTSSRNVEVRAPLSRANRLAPWRANGTTGSSRGTRRAEKDWEQARDQVQSAMREAIGEKQWEENDPNELWEHDENSEKRCARCWRTWARLRSFSRQKRWCRTTKGALCFWISFTRTLPKH